MTKKRNKNNTLPNPDANRIPIPTHFLENDSICDGCNKVFVSDEKHNVCVCKAYAKPAIWENKGCCPLNQRNAIPTGFLKENKGMCYGCENVLKLDSYSACRVIREPLKTIRKNKGECPITQKSAMKTTINPLKASKRSAK